MVMPTGLAIHSIETSNIPPKQKSALLRMVDNLTGGAVEKFQESPAHQSIVHKGHLHSIGHLVRQDSEALLAGMIAGVADAELGTSGAPLTMAVVGAVAAIAASGTWAETTFRNVSATGMGIFGYVEMKDFFGVKKTLSAHGESVEGSDPIIEFGKTL
jgi:hypothetical protein